VSRFRWLLTLCCCALAWTAAAAEPRLDGLETEVFDQRAGRILIGAHRPLSPDSSPDGLRQQLFELSAEGKLELLADDVSSAAYAPDGAVLFVSGDGLFELAKGEPRLITRPVLGDFAVDPLGQRIAVVRPDSEPDSWIELIDRSGRHLATLCEPQGPNAWPLFSPDGSEVYFVSGSTGVYSWFSVRADGERLTQLTNRGLHPGHDVLGPSFVPPPASKPSIRFVDRARIEYDAGDSIWRLELETGKALKLTGARQ
jgi:hypothetical protein